MKRYDDGNVHEQGTIRIEVMYHSIHVEDCENAGKSGKTCKVARVRPRDDKHNLQAMCDVKYNLKARLENVTSLYSLNCWLIEILENLPNTVEVSTWLKKGVDTIPIGLSEFTFSNAHFSVHSNLLRFCASDLTDRANEPRWISCHLDKKTLIARFYHWCVANKPRFDGLTFHQFISLARSETGISGHQYCAMD